MYQSLKRAMRWNPVNTKRGEKAISSASNEKDLGSVTRKAILADFQLPDTEICESCKGSKGRQTFEELQLLQETCDRRETDGNQCIVPVSINQPREQSRALERALEKVLPTAQLRGRSSRYILVRRDPKTELSSRVIYTRVRYDSISRSPSPRIRSRSPLSVRRPRSRSPQVVIVQDPHDHRRKSPSRSRSPIRRSRSKSYSPSPPRVHYHRRARVSPSPERDEGPSYRSIGRSLSRSPSPGRDYGKQTAQISGAQETTASAAGGSLPKLR